MCRYANTKMCKWNAFAHLHIFKFANYFAGFFLRADFFGGLAMASSIIFFTSSIVSVGSFFLLFLGNGEIL